MSDTGIFREFECCALSDKRHPDDMSQWPVEFKEATDRAVTRLLDEHPGAEIAEDLSYCMDQTHPQFPAGCVGKFILVRTVKLNRAVPSPYPPDLLNEAAE